MRTFISKATKFQAKGKGDNKINLKALPKNWRLSREEGNRQGFLGKEKNGFILFGCLKFPILIEELYMGGRLILSLTLFTLTVSFSLWPLPSAQAQAPLASLAGKTKI